MLALTSLKSWTAQVLKPIARVAKRRGVALSEALSFILSASL